jgi:hypothetical protein
MSRIMDVSSLSAAAGSVRQTTVHTVLCEYGHVYADSMMFGLLFQFYISVGS